MVKYSFETVPGTYEELLSLVSEEEILYYYYGEYELDKHLPCPFREEKTPSFLVTYQDGKLKWIRYGIVDRLSNPLDLVRVKYKLNFYQALEKVYNDVYLGKRLEGVLIHNIPLKKERQSISQACSYDENFKDYELQYWEDYYITRPILDKYKIYPCVRYWIGDKVWATSKPGDPAFIFLHGENSWTLYRPLAEDKNKFRKHNISGHVMGLEYLPVSGDHVFITSSYKDIMVLDICGFNAIAPHGEKSIISKELISTLKLSYKNVWVFYDNDATGVEQSIELTKTHGLKYINTPKGSPKDPSDYVKEFGKEKLINFIKTKIKC